MQLPPYLKWSGRKDSNLRPPAPKAGALTRLRYAPTSYTYYMVELGGFEPPASSVRRKRAPPALQPHMINGEYCNDRSSTCQAFSGILALAIVCIYYSIIKRKENIS